MHLNGLRVGKYTVRALNTLVWVIIAMVVVGPAAGFLTPRLGPQYVIGFGVDLGAIAPQLQPLFSGNDVVGTHQITVPVHNKWFFPATASLSLTLSADGKVIYQTQASKIDLQAFQSGQLSVKIQISQEMLSQLQGKRIVVGGVMSFGAPSQLWSLTVNF